MKPPERQEPATSPRLSPPKPEFRVAQIELAASLDTYGIDSMLIVRLTDELEKTFGPLPKTLFFEHRTLDAVLGYFLERHGARLADVSGVRPLASTRVSSRAAKARNAPRGRIFTRPSPSSASLAAIPARVTSKTFWNNLAAGRDCITEVPLDRWDHSRFSGS